MHVRSRARSVATARVASVSRGAQAVLRAGWFWVVLAAVLLLAARAGAEERRFTSELMDTNRSYRILYAPIFFSRLGPGEGDDIPGLAARWTRLALNQEGTLRPSEGSGAYRIIEITEKRDPLKPTDPPEIDIVIEQDGVLPESATSPTVVLVDSQTLLETREVAEVFRAGDHTLYRVELLPPKAALVPEGRRIYLNPSDRYDVQLLRGVRERVAGIRETLPTFGGEDPRDMSTGRGRRRRR